VTIFLLLPKQPPNCEWLSAHSTIIDGKEPVRSFDAMVAALSTVTAIFSRGQKNGPLGSLHESPRIVDMRRLLIIVTAVIALAALTWSKQSVPKVYWNTTPSVPTGLYTLTSRIPAKGDLAIISLPEATAVLADSRGYLPAGSRLIKPVVAGFGDTVCRYGLVVSIEGRPVALADQLDMRQRPLPKWDGCYRLTLSELFVSSRVRGSFDSRYFGRIHVRHVLGTAVPIWTR
jgi:conjugative transfer signal peptidase TraF